MKFLVISKPITDKAEVASHHPETLRTIKAKLEKAKESGKIEHSWSFIGGGFAMIVNADTAEALNKIVRYTPSFDLSSVDITPVVDSADWLDAFADHVEEHHMPKK